MARYLTPATKAEELGHLYSTNLLDSGILPFLEKLNAISGLVTLQSCIGHWKNDYSTGEKYLQPTSFWLRLNESMAQLFYRNAFKLRSLPGIDDVSIRFQPYGHEIVDIVFDSDGTEAFENTCLSVLHFFKQLASEQREDKV